MEHLNKSAVGEIKEFETLHAGQKKKIRRHSNVHQFNDRLDSFLIPSYFGTWLLSVWMLNEDTVFEFQRDCLFLLFVAT